MSIIIHGLDMPTSPILFCIHPDGKVFADLEGGWREYKAIPVPPHGPLIDAEEEEVCEWIHKGGMIYCPECAEGFDAIYKNDFKYCPNCGVKKEGVKE